jgi:branched-chain amino acid transport system ATP-binding protein
MNASGDPVSVAPLLSIEDVSGGYGPILVLRGVSMTVGVGEIVALIGANGAGKTTLLHMISGLMPPSGGVIRFDGAVVSRQPPEALVRLGLIQVPERRQLFATMTVEENLLMGAYHRQNAGKAAIAADVAEMRSLFPVLGERRHQLAGQLSGGEQQMLAVARALMAHPRMLLLDEPSLGLAPLVTRQIMQIIGGFRERGVSVLLVEQNAHAALELAARGYVLELGSVVLEGKAADLLANPRVQSAYLGGTAAAAGTVVDARAPPG